MLDEYIYFYWKDVLLRGVRIDFGVQKGVEEAQVLML